MQGSGARERRHRARRADRCADRLDRGVTNGGQGISVTSKARCSTISLRRTGRHFLRSSPQQCLVHERRRPHHVCILFTRTGSLAAALAGCRRGRRVRVRAWPYRKPRARRKNAIFCYRRSPRPPSLPALLSVLPASTECGLPVM